MSSFSQFIDQGRININNTNFSSITKIKSLGKEQKATLLTISHVCLIRENYFGKVFTY